MKILLINPPNIRDEQSSAENDFAINSFVFSKSISNMKGAGRVFNLLSNTFGLGDGVRYGVRAGSRWPWTKSKPHKGPPYPFFMGYTAANLKEHGYDVDILDAIAEEEYSYDAFLEQVKEVKADIVILECSTPTIDIDIWFANKVAKYTKVAMAGPHLNEETASTIQKENENISFFLLGEYILNSLTMVQSQKEGIYPTEVLKDVDSIPFPYRDYESATKYFDPTMQTPRPQLQIYSSKGCPFKCTFCAWPQNMYFGNVALRKPEKIAQEIKEAVEKYGYKSIFFDDDTFNMGTKRISALCDYLKDIGLPWTMMGRLDISPDWLYDKMIDSGCVGMRFGIETFNIEVLKNVEKGIERKDFKGTLEYITQKYPDLMVHITMMTDMPGQTQQDSEIDMKIIHEMGFSSGNIKRSYQVSRCAPFPGTKLYEQMKEKIGIEELQNYKKYDGGKETVMKQLQK